MAWLKKVINFSDFILMNIVQQYDDRWITLSKTLEQQHPSPPPHWLFFC